MKARRDQLVVDRSRQLGKTVRAISRTLARRTGQRREEVMKLNAKAGRRASLVVRVRRRQGMDSEPSESIDTAHN
jgi:hypothetical protein